MRDSSRRTLIGVVREALDAWRRRERLSQVAVVDNIVDTHYKLEFDRVSEITFEDGGRDVYRRMKTNSDRVYRWLDDQSKDNNLLPSNFLQSILAAMPVDIRLDVANEILNPVGLAAHVLDETATPLDIARMLPELAREGGEATAALAELLDGADEAELRVSHRQMLESITAQKKALNFIEAALAARSKN